MKNRVKQYTTGDLTASEKRSFFRPDLMIYRFRRVIGCCCLSKIHKTCFLQSGNVVSVGEGGFVFFRGKKRSLPA